MKRVIISKGKVKTVENIPTTEPMTNPNIMSIEELISLDEWPDISIDDSEWIFIKDGDFDINLF